MASEPGYGAPAPASDDHSAHLWNHIVDLHRKHSELALQMHDARTQSAQSSGGDEMKHLTQCIDENTAALKEQTGILQQLLAVMKQDVKSDKAVAASGRK